MEKLTSFTLDDNQGTVLIEASDVPAIHLSKEKTSGYETVSRDNEDNTVITKATQRLSDALGPVRATSESILNAFRNFTNAPDELEIELSVKVTTEAGVIIAKGSLEGNFKITLKWKKETSASLPMSANTHTND